MNNLFFPRPCTLTTERHVSATEDSSILDLCVPCVYQVRRNVLVLSKKHKEGGVFFRFL